MTTIGVKLSGGADSSIIYYMLCDKYKNNPKVDIAVITLDTDVKNWYIDGAKRIIKIVGELTGKYPIEHFTNTVTHSNENYLSGQEDLVQKAILKYNIKDFYNGVTNNPNVFDMTAYFKKQKKVNRKDKLKHNDEWMSIVKALAYRDKTRDTGVEVNLQSPLFDKLSTAKAYKDHNMMEKLYPYTYSCEDDANDPKDGHCGTCFFCLERLFAFGRIV